MKNRLVIKGENPGTVIEKALANVGSRTTSRPVQAELVYSDGFVYPTRVAISSRQTLMLLYKGRRRYGSSIPYKMNGADLAAIHLQQEASGGERTPAQEYADDLRKRRDYFMRNATPGVWDNLRRELAAVTDEALAEFASMTGPRNHYEAWKLAGDMGLPRIERHKTLTLKACNCPQHIMAIVAESMAQRKNFREWWRGSYDYSCSGKMCDDGIYRAWLSQEFKGCGNGHYWLLISPTQAIFCEDD